MSRLSVPAVVFVAPSGSGKTTFLESVVRELSRRRWRVGAVKHAAHGFAPSPEGTDSRRLEEAGASPVAVVSPRALCVTRKVPDGGLTPLAVVESTMEGADIVLIEGFKSASLPKVEIFRKDAGRGLLLVSPEGLPLDDNLLAVVSDVALDFRVPVFPLDDAGPLCDFLERTFLHP